MSAVPHTSARTRRRLTTAAAAAVVALVYLLGSGCSFTGVNSVPLPFGKGGADDDLRVTVLLQNATNLVPNAEVKYRDITVGSIRKIQLDDWHAKLTLGIDKDAGVPAQVTAKVAQKSLLGAEYLELAPPSDPAHMDTAATDPLKTGAVIGLGRTGRYPETEEVLSAAALLLNNGGIGKVQAISHELNSALDGRTGDVKSFVREVTELTSHLDAQRGAIVDTLAQLDRFSAGVRRQHARVDRALRDLPSGIETLSRERKNMVKALSAVDDLSTTAHRVLSRTTDGLATNLANLRPVTRQLSQHAKELAESVDFVTFPFPIKSINRAFFGDYINQFGTLNLDLGEMAKYWGTNNLLGVLFGPLVGVQGSTVPPGQGNGAGTGGPSIPPTGPSRKPGGASTSPGGTSGSGSGSGSSSGNGSGGLVGGLGGGGH